MGIDWVRRGVVAGLLAAVGAAAPAEAVVGGHAPTREYPSFVHVQRIAAAEADDTGCGGSLIRRRWVLTAAHCVTQAQDDGTYATVDPSEIRLMFGRTQRHVPAPLEIRDPVRIVRHPDFVYGESALSPGGGADVALIELARAVRYPPIRIPRESERHRWEPGDVATLIGFGIDEVTPLDWALPTLDPSRTSDVLLEAQVPIVADDDCETWWLAAGTAVGIRVDRRTMLCAGYPEGGTDSCYYDSGGPLMVPGAGDAMLQVGVVSVTACGAPRHPGIYARVAEPSLRSWLMRTSRPRSARARGRES